jgi:hypothetical protein
MTEQEWGICTDPTRMLTFVKGRASKRKFRLFAVSCCRHVWRFLTDERTRRAVEVNEAHVDGSASDEQLRLAGISAQSALDGKWNPTWAAQQAVDSGLRPQEAFLVEYTKLLQAEFEMMWAVVRLGESGPEQSADLAAWASAWHPGGTQAAEKAYQSDLLRDLFGPLPFRQFPPAPQVITPLANDIYASRWDLLPLLGEWLQEHGYCAEGEHCLDLNLRHVKGCWVVDWVTGRE